MSSVSFSNIEEKNRSIKIGKFLLAIEKFVIFYTFFNRTLLLIPYKNKG
ncbi:hypothetical protein ACLSZY_03715 [Avibacterium volantium]